MSNIQFPLSQVARMAELPVSTIRDWFNSEDGAFSLHRRDQAAPAGGTRQLSPYTVVAVLIAARLTRLGVPISRAAQAGMTFAHTSGGRKRRNSPGALFSGPVITLLSVSADGEIKIFPASAKSDPLEIVSVICSGGGATIIEVNPLVARVENEMNDKFRPQPAKVAEWR